MFENWGFLLGEMRGLLAVAAALGLGAGWLIWGGRAAPPAAEPDPETARLRTALEAEGQRARALEARLAALETAAPPGDGGESRAPGPADAGMAGDGPPEDAEAAPEPVRMVAAVAVSPEVGDAPVDAAPGDGTDDLTRIRGIGPKLAALLHGLGIRRFEQIAGWSDEDLARIDARLDGFRGRAARDGWVEQARRIVAEREGRGA